MCQAWPSVSAIALLQFASGASTAIAGKSVITRSDKVTAMIAHASTTRAAAPVDSSSDVPMEEGANDTRLNAKAYLTSSRIARSSPSSVSGYIRLPISWRIIRIEYV